MNTGAFAEPWPAGIKKSWGDANLHLSESTSMHSKVSICQGGEPEDQHVKSPGVQLNIDVGGVAFENVESLEILTPFVTINDQKEDEINGLIDLGDSFN